MDPLAAVGPPAQTNRGFGWLLACFIGSGMSALIYEVAWVRSLELVFGTTTFAIATVLAAFMGGLALGSFVMGRLSTGSWHPLKLYALIEVFIALTAFAIPWLFEAMIPLYRFIWKYTHASFITFSLLRFLLSALVLLIPTFLMGATLPLLSRFVSGDAKLGTSRIGFLYTGNTVGAVLGCAAAGLLLFPLVGLAHTQQIGMALNLVAAGGAFVLARLHSSGRLVSNAEPGVTPPARRQENRGLLIAIYSFSGLTAMLYEVTWSRVLVLVLGSSTYAYTTMLVTFLLGLSLGAGLGTRWLRKPPPLLTAGLCQLAVALSTYASLFVVEELPYLYLQAYRSIGPSAAGLLSIQFLLAGGLMIVPTLALGAMFPVIIHGLQPEGNQAGRVVGWAYALNTAGAIAGSVVTGFWLIPSFGSQSTLLIGVVLNAALALSALVRLTKLPLFRYRLPVSGAIAIFCAGAVLSQTPWSAALMSTGVFRYAREFMGMDRDKFRETARRIGGEVLLFKEGLTSTITVFRNASSISLLVNGKPDASTPTDLPDPLAAVQPDGLHDLPTQSMLGHIPLLLAPKQDQVLVIGLGSGVTVKSVLTYPIKRLECIELEDAVVRGSRFFEKFNDNPLNDPRTQLVVNDARNHLLVTDQTYDVVISEPSNPWIPGAANLFTREFFQICQHRLTDQGVFCQWVQLYELQPVHFAAILKTFSSVFPSVHLFRVNHDAILVGARADLPLNIEQILSRWHGQVASDLDKIRVHNLAQFLSYYWSGGSELVQTVGSAGLNTDNNMLIEFAAPLQVLASAGKHTAADFLKDQKGLPTNLAFAHKMEPATFWSELAEACLDRDQPELALNYGQRAETTGGNPLAVRSCAYALTRLGQSELAAETLRTGLERFADEPTLLIALAENYSHAGEWEQARQQAARACAQQPDNTRAIYLLGRSQYYLNRHDESLETLEKISSSSTNAAQLRDLPFYLGSLYWLRHDNTQAAKYYSIYLRRDPNHMEARAQLADAFYHLNRLPEARTQWQLLARLSSVRASQLLSEAQTAWQGEDVRRASMQLDQARQYDPWNLDVLLPLARAKALQGDRPGAIRMLEEYLEWNPDRPAAIGYLGELLKLSGQAERARLVLARYHALTGEAWVQVDGK